MATTEIPFLLGMIVEDQTLRGTATAMPAIAGGAGTAGAFNLADGAVLGDPSAGVGRLASASALAKTSQRRLCRQAATLEILRTMWPALSRASRWLCR